MKYKSLKQSRIKRRQHKIRQVQTNWFGQAENPISSIIKKVHVARKRITKLKIKQRILEMPLTEGTYTITKISNDVWNIKGDNIS